MLIVCVIVRVVPECGNRGIGLNILPKALCVGCVGASNKVRGETWFHETADSHRWMSRWKTDTIDI